MKIVLFCDTHALHGKINIPDADILIIPLPVIQRGNNRQACFFADEDFLFYLDWLHEYARTQKTWSVPNYPNYPIRYKRNF